MMEENKNLGIQKKGEVKISKKGWIGLGLIIISLFILNSFASNPPYEDEEQAIRFILSLPLFLILLIGIILFFLGSKGYERKLILILIISPFILRALIGIEILYLPDGITMALFNTKEIEKAEKEAINAKNPEKCFFEVKKMPLISYFLIPPEREMNYIVYYIAPLTTKCVTDIAVAIKDTSLCELLKEKKFILHMDPSGNIYKVAGTGVDCYQQAFLASEKYKDDLLICKLNNDCIETIAIQKNDPELCNAVYYSKPCFTKIALQRNDPKICEMIVDEFNVDLDKCLIDFAIETKNLEVCDLARGPYYGRHGCIREVENAIR